MDQEQLEKRIEWLEKERREDKQAIALLEKRLTDYESSIGKSSEKTQELESEITQLGVKLTRLDTFDHGLSLVRKDVKKELEGYEKEQKKRDQLAKQRHEEAFGGLHEKAQSQGIALVRTQAGLILDMAA